MGDRGHNRHGPKRGGGLLCAFRRELGPRLIQCGLDRGLLPYQVAFSSIQPFGHNRHEPKSEGCAPFRGECCDPPKKRSLGRGYLRTKWHLDPSSRSATIDICQKFGGAVPFFWGSWVPSNTQSPVQAYTFVTSVILVHPAVLPQRTLAENWGLCPFMGGGAGCCAPLGKESWVPI